MSDIEANVRQFKRRAAEAAWQEVREGMILGVGTGSTAEELIELLGSRGPRLQGAVSSSRRSSQRLEAHGIPLLTLEQAGSALELYVDGADEIDPGRRLTKGGGGALTREKILAAASERFLCIADGGKCVDRLGAFPLPIEVIPLALGYVARRLASLGGRPLPREGFVTDNGNAILDVHGLEIDDPVGLESELNQLAGVVCNGLFARRPADEVILGEGDGIRRF